MAKAKSPAGRPASPAASRGPRGPRPTISLCMMVKNEEKRLPTALKSAAPWVDEIIVVDTGSTDRSVEIAKEYGAKVYHHPWEYNFSKHRNQSLSYATGDWLLILDADEELDQETAPMIRQLALAPREVGGFLFEMFNVVAPGGETFILHPRMFRNNIGFHYEGHVHNRPVLPGAIARSTVKLRHYGYNEDPATMEAKHQRRLDMIRKWAQDDPDNFSPHSYLAHTLACRRETQVEALEEALLALRLLGQSSEADRHYPHVYYPLLQSLLELSRDEELIEHANDCIRRAPFYPDATFFLVMAQYRQHRWEEVCQQARVFLEQQRQCLEHPEKFIFFENLTYNQQHQVVMRWVLAAAHLGRAEEAREAFETLFPLRDPESSCKLAIKDLLTSGYLELAQEFSALANQREPGWLWAQLMGRLAGEKLREISAHTLREDGAKALQEGRAQDAIAILRQALAQSPLNAEVLLNLGAALDAEGNAAEAEPLIMQGLNAHPGHAWAWKRLGDASFAEGNHPGAAACYRRYLSLTREDAAISSRLTACERRLAEAGPNVTQRPPRLVVFLLGGLTPQMVEQAGPHFMLGTAWGRLQHPEEALSSDLAGWAALYTGTPAGVHGLAQGQDWSRPLGLGDLAVPSLWELLPADCTLGFVAAPLIQSSLVQPSLNLPGWALPGYPAGLLTPDLVRPREWAPVALAAGYRSDFVLNEFEEQTIAQRLQNDVRQEAFLYQAERNKLAAATAMPAVDVLVVGLTGLEYMLRAHGLTSYQAFTAHQQAYAWIEGLLSALRPANFAVLSQRAYTAQEREPSAGGFYCLSWLKGESGQVEYTQIAPEILKLMGGDLSGLGRPRQGTRTLA